MLLALLLLLAATTPALEQDGKDYDLYTTASALRNLAGGFASEVEVTADGRVKKLIFDGTADLLAEARALVNALATDTEEVGGEACLLELDELGARIADAGLRARDFRFLASFSLRACGVVRQSRQQAPYPRSPQRQPRTWRSQANR
mgnify:CR=1 FL=1